MIAGSATSLVQISRKDMCDKTCSCTLYTSGLGLRSTIQHTHTHSPRYNQTNQAAANNPGSTKVLETAVRKSTHNHFIFTITVTTYSFPFSPRSRLMLLSVFAITKKSGRLLKSWSQHSRIRACTEYGT